MPQIPDHPVPQAGEPEARAFLSYSGVLTRLLAALGGRQTPDDSIFELVSLDPVLAWRALELYAQRHAGDSLRGFGFADLLRGLDIRALKSIVTTAATERCTRVVRPGRHASWISGLRCAALSRSLAEQQHYSSPDEAWLAGLLVWLPDFSCDFEAAPAAARAAAQAALDRLPLRSFLADALRYLDMPSARLRDAAPLVQMVVAAHHLVRASPVEFNRKSDLSLLNTLFLTSKDDHEVMQDMLTQADRAVRTFTERFRLEKTNNHAVGDLALELIRYNQLELAASAMQENHETAILSLADLLASHEGLADPIYLKLNRRTSFLEAQPLGEHPFAPLAIRVEGSKTAAVRALFTRTPVIVLESAGHAAAVLDLQLIRQADADGLVAIPVGESDSQGVLLVCGSASALTVVAEMPKHYARMGELAGRMPLAGIVIESGQQTDELPTRVRRAAHEINNPLGIIKNYLAILKTKLGDDAPISDELRIIYEELDRIVRIVRELARDPEASSGLPESADLNALIQDLVKVTQPTWQSKGVQVTAALTPGLAGLSEDRDKLKQIVLNLLLNAIEATPADGTVRIETAMLSNHRHENFIEIIVSDSGAGISPEIAANIFDPLDTAKGDGHAGLGLSIVKSLTEAMRGNIIFKTSASGTTFQILLPTN